MKSVVETKILAKPETNAVTQSQDDLDALMSPRATEFTKNPFHVDLPTETPVKQSHGFDFGFVDTRKPTNEQKDVGFTPAKADPRSPALTGSSPIVRNIWEFL